MNVAKKLRKKILILVTVGFLLTGCALVKSEEVKSVETLESEEQINNVYTAYNALSDSDKKVVENYNILIESKTTLDNLKVTEVETKINLIKEQITISDETVIAEANEALKNLDVNLQSKVSNRDKLTNALDKLKNLKKTEANKILSGFKKEVDKVQNITFYSSKQQPYYADTRSYVLPYIGINNSTGYVFLRNLYWYTGDDWVFFKKVIVSVDGKNYYRTFSYFDITHDNEYGNVWEYIDVAVTDTDIEILNAIAKSKEAIVRFQGDDYHYDLTVKSSDKQEIKKMLTAYNYLKN